MNKYTQEQLNTHGLQAMRKLSMAFNHQRFTAGGRSDAEGNAIEWKLTFEEWLAIWESSGNIALRGKGKDLYVMSRFDDVGPYAKDNVEIITFGENVRRARKAETQDQRAWRCIPKSVKRDKGLTQNPFR